MGVWWYYVWVGRCGRVVVLHVGVWWYYIWVSRCGRVVVLCMDG